MGDCLLHESLQRGPIQRMGLGVEVQQQSGGGGDDFPEPGLAQGVQRAGQGRRQGSPAQERRLIGALREAHPPGVGARGGQGWDHFHRFGLPAPAESSVLFTFATARRSLLSNRSLRA